MTYYNKLLDKAEYLARTGINPSAIEHLLERARLFSSRFGIDISDRIAQIFAITPTPQNPEEIIQRKLEELFS